MYIVEQPQTLAGWFSDLNPVKVVQKVTASQASVIKKVTPSPLAKVVTATLPGNVIASQAAAAKALAQQKAGVALALAAKSPLFKKVMPAPPTIPEQVPADTSAGVTDVSTAPSGVYPPGGNWKALSEQQPNYSYSAQPAVMQRPVSATVPPVQAIAAPAPILSPTPSPAPVTPALPWYMTQPQPAPQAPVYAPPPAPMTSYQSSYQGANAPSYDTTVDSGNIPTTPAPEAAKTTPPASGIGTGTLLTLLAAGVTLLK